MRIDFLTVLAVSFMSFGSSASAWGETGHRVVCEIAFKELGNNVRKEVVRLIRTDSEYRYFYDSCNWADKPTQRSQRGGEHYVNLHRKANGIVSGNECGPPGRCVITAIMKEVNEYSVASTDAGRLYNLKFLGHWVGDLHQPLHVSFSDDRGGNNIKENGPCSGSLHRVWDSCILEKSLGDDPVQIADDLRAEITDDERTAWTTGIAVIDIDLV